MGKWTDHQLFSLDQSHASGCHVMTAPRGNPQGEFPYRGVQQSFPHPPCFSDVEMTSMAPALPPQPTLPITHMMLCHCRTQPQTFPLPISENQAKAIPRPKGWVGQGLTACDGHQWIFVNVPMHTPHFHPSCSVLCLSLNQA